MEDVLRFNTFSIHGRNNLSLVPEPLTQMPFILQFYVDARTSWTPEPDMIQPFPLELRFKLTNLYYIMMFPHKSYVCSNRKFKDNF